MNIIRARAGAILKPASTFCILSFLSFGIIPKWVYAAPEQGDGKLRIIAFGAHPDDCELRTAGTAAQWAALGHHVKFVSVTNGDIGHWKMAGGPLARRRTAEVQKCARILGIDTQV